MAELRIDKPTLIAKVESAVFVMDADGSLRRATPGMQLEPGTRLVLDLNGLEYISSAGLRVILSAAKKMKARNGKLGLSRLQPRVREVFQVSGFSSIIPVFETLPAALDAVR